MNKYKKFRPWDQDLKDSSEAFKNIVYPQIKYLWFEGGELLPVESNPDKVSKVQDMVGGLDYLVNIYKVI